MKFFFIGIFAIVLLCCGSITCLGQQEKFKAVFLFNFAKNLEWSDPFYQKGDFIIGVFSGSPIIEDLEIVAGKTKIGQQPIIVKKFSKPEDIEKCHILFVPKNKSSQLPAILSKVSSYKTVIVTEKDGMAKQGAGINFYMQDGELKFEINKINIEKPDVKIKPALLVLGRTVI